MLRPIYYQNGNYKVTITADGVKTRTLDNGETEWKPERLENVDLCVSRRCRFGCPMCYNDSKPDGPVASIENISAILNQLPKHTEVAIGGGALSEFKDLPIVLGMCKERELITNITLKQQEFEEMYPTIKAWQRQNLVYGVGVSVTDVNARLLGMLTDIEYAVAHVIAGYHSEDMIWQLRGVPVLLLGFKNIGRAEDMDMKEKIAKFKDWFWNHIDGFYRVGFDNLSMQQLDAKGHLPKEKFDKAYLGEDGTGFNAYIDAVCFRLWRNSLLDGNGYSLHKHMIAGAVNLMKNER